MSEPTSRADAHLASRNDHKLWHGRGYLPHFDAAGVVQAVTFRLADALPSEIVERWRAELGYRGDLRADDPAGDALRARITRFEDAGHGECWLTKPEIGRIVEDALLHFDGQRYRLPAWCVMPNHVHAVVETYRGWPLDRVVQSWKSFTSKRANAALGRRGEFWMADYFDRFIRNERHFAAAVSYVERNPVAAGLVQIPEAWRFSSARRRPAGRA
jgi:putative transposase